MIARHAPVRAANDNLRPASRPRAEHARWPRGIARAGSHPSGSYPLWVALLIFGFSGLVLTILCGAFLLELAAVGVVAAAIATIELARAVLPRRFPIGVVHQPVA